MPLAKQVVPVSLVKGQEKRLDKLLIQGRLQSLQNGSLTATGSIQRRDGWTQAASVTAANGLSVLGGELLAINNGALSSFSPDAGNAMLPRGTISPCLISLQQLIRSGGAQDSYDAATAGGLTCYVWIEYLSDGTTVGVKCSVFDEATGTIVMPPTLMDAAGYAPRVVAVSGAFMLFYGGAATTIKCRVILTSTPTTLGAASTLQTDLGTVWAIMDAIGIGPIAFVYYVSNAASAASSKIFAATQTNGVPSVTTTTVVTLDANVSRGQLSGMSIAAFDASTIGLYALATSSATNGPGLWATVVSSALAVVAGPTRIDAAAAPTGNYGGVTAVLNGSTMWVYSDDAGSNGGGASVKPIRRSGLNAANAVTSGPATWINSMVRPSGTNGPFIASKAFAASGIVYVPVFILGVGTGTTGTLQDSWFLLSDSGAVVGRAAYGSFGIAFGLNTLLGSAVVVGGAVAALVKVVTELSFSAGLNVSATGIARLLLNFAAVPPVNAQDGSNLFFAGGLLSAYDGTSATEAGFLLFPEVVTVANGAAGVVDAGVHQWVALYEWVDGAGQRHQSAPSVAVSFTMDGAHKATVTIPTLPLTAKTGVTIVVYRTVANGSTFFRLNAVNAPIANTTAAAVVTYTDNTTDAVLQSGELLYTTGGALPNNAPGACSVVCQHQGRLFVDTENPLQGRYSQVQVQGIGLQWNEALTFYLPAESGGITGYASQDDRLVVFGKRKIYIITGSGPTPSGAQNGYSSPQEIASDVGCIERHSILRTPAGIIFKSAKGWHLLGRDLSVQYIGSAVESRNGDAVSGIVLLEDRKEIRVSSPTGTALVFSYLSGEWSEYLNYAATDAVWWPGGGKYVHCTSAGAINADAPGTQVDGGAAAIPITFQTAWLRPGETIHGFERCWRFLLGGAYGGDSTLTIQVDFLPGNLPSETHTFAHSSSLADGAGNWLARIHLATQKFAAARFTVTDTPNAPGPGLSFSSIALELGLKRGAIKLSAGQSG